MSTQKRKSQNPGVRNAGVQGCLPTPSSLKQVCTSPDTIYWRSSPSSSASFLSSKLSTETARPSGSVFVKSSKICTFHMMNVLVREDCRLCTKSDAAISLFLQNNQKPRPLVHCSNTTRLPFVQRATFFATLGGQKLDCVDCWLSVSVTHLHTRKVTCHGGWRSAKHIGDD